MVTFIELNSGEKCSFVCPNKSALNVAYKNFYRVMLEKLGYRPHIIIQ